MIATASSDDAWVRLVRPLHQVHPDDAIESILLRMQDEEATLYLVADAGAPVGLITLEDILEQVVGRIEDEYPHEPDVSLREAIAAGGILLDLSGGTAEQAITELAAAVPAERLPANAQVAESAITREREVSTDLGSGVAIPHARVAHLDHPLVVFGRSAGVVFSPQSPELVRLIFLLVTPLDQPDIQLALLGRLARVAGSRIAREQLLAASSESEVLEICSREHFRSP
jgi:mannitol/fructose-specific phosphotransferase system IIA component (Ntr-type)